MIKEKTGPSILITGAASGIGKATVEELARGNNARIFATDVDTSISEVFPKSRYPKVVTGVLDVRASDQILERVGRIAHETGGVDVLINNAGVMSRGRGETYFKHGKPTQEYVDMWQTNVEGPIHLMAAVLPGMRDAGEGVIVNVTSTKYLKPEPFGQVYGELKQVLSGVTADVAKRERKNGIRVVDVQPGYTRTHIDRGVWTDQSNIFEVVMWQREMFLWSIFAQKASKVAKAICGVIAGENLDDVVVVGLESQIPYFFYRHLKLWPKIFWAYANYCIVKGRD